MIEITNKVEEAKLITHSGIFHPDDVFSTAFLSKIYPDSKVIRVNNVSETTKDQIVYDIGFGRFDHHGPDAKWRNEKIKYSSLGLLWKEYGVEYLKNITDNYEDVWNRIDTKLVCQIDGIDNGNFPTITADYELMDLDHIIDLYNSNWNEEKNNDSNFIRAVSVASEIFDNLVRREIAYSMAFAMVKEAIKNTSNNLLILDKYIPYEEALFSDNNSANIKAVIFPATRGGYTIKPVTVGNGSYELKYNFPKEWWGLHDEELVEKSGVKTAKFLHSNGFIAVTDNLDDAVLLCNYLV